MSDSDTRQRVSRPGREGKTTLAAWVSKDGAFVFQELLLRLSRERGTRVTMQEAVTEAINDYGRKHGMEINLS